MRVFDKEVDFRVLSIENHFSEYSNLFSMAQNKNVYMLPSYLKCAPIAEKYPAMIMVYTESNKIAMMPYIKRRINDLPLFKGLSQECWDIISPYEYAAVITNSPDIATHHHICRKLFEAIARYCEEENIICEFVRFDPFFTDLNCLGAHYHLNKSCDNIYIDLTKAHDELWAAFHSSAKKNIKHAEIERLHFIEAEKSRENIDIFIYLYSASMQRLGAKEYYYFSKSYFNALLQECEGAPLFIISDAADRPIAASILLHYGGIGHHHLTGYEAEAKHIRPNDYMIYSLIQWGKKHQLRSLHLGGGSDPICNFKSKFSNTSIPYYIGYRVHNQEMYQFLCDCWRKDHSFSQPSEFFPLYRLELI